LNASNSLPFSYNTLSHSSLITLIQRLSHEGLVERHIRIVKAKPGGVFVLRPYLVWIIEVNTT